MTKSSQLQSSKTAEKAVLARVIADVAQQCKVQSSQIEDLYPCTPLQHALFVLSSTSDGAYIAQHIFKLPEHVDRERMKKAWNTVILRNAIFRTRLVALDSRVLQVVLKDWLPEWRTFMDRARYLESDREQTIDFGEPMIRLAISKTHLVWTAHHSIYDGYSVELMLADIATVYREGNLSVRPPFRNFVKYAQVANDNSRSKYFWETKLSAPAKDVLSFPPVHLDSTRRPRPDSSIEHDTTPLITGPSGVTMATLVQAAWALVLSSQLGSSTISYGTTLNGRNADLAGIDKIIGPTLSTVPVCFKIDYEQSISQYLQNTQKLLTQMIPQIHVGIQTIKEINQDTARACEFQNLLAVHFVGEENSRPTYEDLMERDYGSVSTDFLSYALTIQCYLTNSGRMRASASFDSTLINSSRTQRLLFQLEHIIRQLGSSHPSKSLREVNLISPQDIKQIELWNMKPERPDGFSLDEINRQFSVRPDSIAICAWDGEVSYSKLDDLSSRLASYLISEHAIGPEVIVPVCFEKSLWMTVAVVAVMKTGAAFTLLDTAHPQKRLETIIELTKAKTVLVSKACRNKFTQTATKEVVVDNAAFELNGLFTSFTAPTSNPRSTCSEWLSLKNAMYVVFTSGSTGQPKGVVITFGSYYAGALAHISSYELGPESRVLNFGAPAFDLCIVEIVSTLMAGGCICVPSEIDRFGGIANAIQSMNVNVASLTPAFARQISPDDVPNLKKLALVGEELPKDQRDVWVDKLCLLNAYGPAECSVISTINKRMSKSTVSANIGPIILGSGWITDPDDQDRLVPIGATGELLIEGPLLGRGYLNAPEKTAENFVKNALRTVDPTGAERLFYKTGDLVRYDVDGSLIFEGRKDTQVKIRGQRVEIGEVEYHVRKMFVHASEVAVELSKHDNVVELIAFIFCDGLWDTTQEPQRLLPQLSHPNIRNVSDIKSRLKEGLPHHMVPNRYLLVPKLATLPSGKIDRKFLRQEILNSSGSYFQLQENEKELSLIDPENTVALELSKKILQLHEARNTSGAADLRGRDLNIAELGLDSIQLINILTFIRKEYDIKLSVAVLYDEKLSISELAKIVSEHQTGITAHNVEQVVDLAKQIQDLYDDFLKRSQNPANPGKTVFLTGATGYLGSEILRQLLNDPSIKKVIVHVRASNAASALDRISHAASLGQWWSPSYAARIECWPGDLAAPKLGLLPTQWSILTGYCHPNDRIDSIIHNGALVQWQAPYSALKAANVDSTLELLSAVHQWSIPGSFTYVSGGAERALDMDWALFTAQLQHTTGYNQTKFVSEELTRRFASSQSVHNISIVRPGLIIGTEKEGVPNTDDFLWKLVQACLVLGGYPAENQNFWLSVADVNEVATSVIFSNLRPEASTPKTWYIDTGVVVGDFWAVVNEELNQSLKPLSGVDWVRSIHNIVSNADENHTFHPLIAMFEGESFSLGSPMSTEATSDTRIYPALRKNLRTLISTGYLFTHEQCKDEKTASSPIIERKAMFGRSGIVTVRPGQIMKV
ncbi:hypothetical protein ACMFMG_011430 [Clarireedia jacksonii]